MLHSVLCSCVIWHFSIFFILLVADKHHNNFGVCVLQDLLIPLIYRLERLHAGHVVNQESPDASPKEEGCEAHELFLAQRIPDVHLCPLLSVLNVEHFGNDLDNSSALGHLVELVEDASVRD